MEDCYLEVISDSASTGLEDRISLQIHSPCYPDICLESEPQLFPYSNHQLSNYSAEPEDKYITCLCEICHKNIIKINDSSSSLRKKRKINESQLIVASMKVCKECRMLKLEDLKTISGSTQGKIVVKRENAKRRVQENEKNIREQQEKLIEDNSELSEGEKKKMKQIIRNRISAQQSRDRKKAYVAQLTDENNQLKLQNTMFKYKIQELSQENAYLKNQLSGMHLNSSSSSSIKGASLGLMVFVGIILIINMNSNNNSVIAKPRHLLSNTTDEDDILSSINTNLSSNLQDNSDELALLYEQRSMIVEYRN